MRERLQVVGDAGMLRASHVSQHHDSQLLVGKVLLKICHAIDTTAMGINHAVIILTNCDTVAVESEATLAVGGQHLLELFGSEHLATVESVKKAGLVTRR